MLINVMILLATVLAFFFPACLIDAITQTLRGEDKAKVESSRAKACTTFGMLVFITLCLINS